MSEKTHTQIIYGLIVILVAALVVLYFFGGKSMSHCEYIKYVYEMEISGFIIEKLDNTNNHNEHGFKIKSGDKEYYLALTSDLRRGNGNQSLLWHKGLTGDSILKKMNSYKVKLISEGVEYHHEILFHDSSCD